MGFSTVRVAAISDTHTFHRVLTIPECDILLHAGDSTNGGEVRTLQDLGLWAEDVLPRTVTPVLISGNHDLSFQRCPIHARKALGDRWVYIQDEEVVVGGLRIYGTPWTPTYGIDWAFNLDRGHPIRKSHRNIPKGVDILLSHGPPKGVCDRNLEGENVGCRDLKQRIIQTMPQVVVCGHVHEARGEGFLCHGKVRVLNVSTLDRRYTSVSPPVVFEVTPR